MLMSYIWLVIKLHKNNTKITYFKHIWRLLIWLCIQDTFDIKCYSIAEKEANLNSKYDKSLPTTSTEVAALYML